MPEGLDEEIGTPSEEATLADVPAGDRVPEGGREVDRVAIDVEEAFPEITRLKVAGVALFVMAGTFAVLPTILVGSGFGSVAAVVSLALAVAGSATGIASLVSPALRRVASVAGPGLLLAAVAVDPVGTSLDAIPLLEMLLAFGFAITWLLAIEHVHAVARFVELGSYINRQRLSTFQLSSVVNHFTVYSLGMAGLIVLVASVVVLGVPWAFAQGSDPIFGSSAELSSVFGIAIAAAVVFTIAGIILVAVRTVMPQRVEVEHVAYSRDTLEDMLRSARVLETRRRGGGGG